MKTNEKVSRLNSVEQIEQKLVRAVGFKGIIALTINAIIGAGIFTVPALVAGTLGISSPIVFALAGLFTLIIVLCFAELSGFFERTGGAYLYAHEAFGGGIIAFLIGWMYFLARLTALAALSNALVGFLGFFFDVSVVLRAILIISAISLLGIINYLGIRLSARVINFLTVAKLSSLLLLICAGFVLLDLSYLKDMRIPPTDSLIPALLVVMFVFTGFEVIAIPGAEVIHPRRNLPLGMLIGTIITILIYLLVQIVAVGADAQLASSKRPLADAAQKLMGIKGGMILSIGAVCSTMGTLMSLLLSGSRILFAMGINEQMPAVFSKVHSKYRTPYVSIVLYTIISIVLTLSGTFTTLATLSAIARLMTYIGSAVALLILRKKISSPDTFRIPGGPVVPVIAILLSLFLLTAATRIHWITGSAAIVVGLVLYLIRNKKEVRKEPGAVG